MIRYLPITTQVIFRGHFQLFKIPNNPNTDIRQRLNKIGRYTFPQSSEGRDCIGAKIHNIVLDRKLTQRGQRGCRIQEPA